MQDMQSGPGHADPFMAKLSTNLGSNLEKSAELLRIIEACLIQRTLDPPETSVRRLGQLCERLIVPDVCVQMC
jgi:hypothetical protein